MMRRPNHSRDREKAIDKIVEQFKTRIASLQAAFFRAALEYLRDNLDVRNNVIRATNKNVTTINNLSFMHEAFQKKEGTTLLKWMARKYVELLVLNRKYFSDVTTTAAVNGIRKKLERRTLSQLGIKLKDNKISLAKGSFLTSINNYDEALRRVKGIATSIATNRGDIRTLTREIRVYKNSNSATLPAHHLATAARDSFARLDRDAGKEYASQLGLRAFIYQGGEIQTSRDFCIERNNRVFTIEEAEKWSDLEWNGKNEAYVPLRDLGGHNCRHQTDWISKKLAIRLRPELEEYFNNN